MIEKIISILLMILLFYWSINSVQNFSKVDTEKLTFLIKEFNLGFIEDIQVKDIPATCDNNYTPIDFDFNYPGNYKGCQCVDPKDKNKIEGSFTDCPAGRTGCVFFKERNLQKILYWKSKLICLKRTALRLRDFFLTNSTAIKCDEGFKNCGKIDSLGNQLCLSNSAKCPITNLRVMTDETEISQYNKSVDNKTQYLHHFSNNTYLAYETKPVGQTSNVVTFNLFNAGVSLQPCLYSDRFPKGDLFFPLEKNFNNFGCHFDSGIIYSDTTNSLDNRFRLIDNTTTKSLYTDNGLQDLITDIGLVYPEVPKQTIFFSGREFIGWSLECRLYENGLNSFLNAEDLIGKLLLANITHSFIMLLFGLAIAISSCFFIKYYEALFRIITIAFCILNLIYPIQIISKANYVVNTMMDENGNYCSDQNANRILKDISNACNDLSWSYQKSLFVTVIYTLIIIYGLYKWIKPYHEQYQDTYKKYIDRR